ncbi:MAG: AraC family transcriptional regulator, partial [Bacteroidota bacterium]
LALHSVVEQLASKGYVNAFQRTQNDTLDKIYEYIFQNFDQSISLEEIAGLANMNPSAFSRYFKRINQKTFSRYVNEIRIGFACRQLMEQKDNVSTICYESGFNNLSNFNRQFRLIKGISPSEYRKQYQSQDQS